MCVCVFACVRECVCPEDDSNFARALLCPSLLRSIHESPQFYLKTSNPRYPCTFPPYQLSNCSLFVLLPLHRILVSASLSLFFYFCNWRSLRSLSFVPNVLLCPCRYLLVSLPFFHCEKQQSALRVSKLVTLSQESNDMPIT